MDRVRLFGVSGSPFGSGDIQIPSNMDLLVLGFPQISSRAARLGDIDVFRFRDLLSNVAYITNFISAEPERKNKLVLGTFVVDPGFSQISSRVPRLGVIEVFRFRNLLSNVTYITNFISADSDDWLNEKIKECN